MIYITDIRMTGVPAGVPCWAIVRSLKSQSAKIRQVAALSPSKSLFFGYCAWKKAGMWNRQCFEQRYVPQFLREMHSPEAVALLNELYLMDRRGEDIALACFCTDEELCHRSIIAGLLQGCGCRVQTLTGNDYSHYWRMYNAA